MHHSLAALSNLIALPGANSMAVGAAQTSTGGQPTVSFADLVGGAQVSADGFDVPDAAEGDEPAGGNGAAGSSDAGADLLSTTALPGALLGFLTVAQEDAGRDTAAGSGKGASGKGGPASGAAATQKGDPTQVDPSPGAAANQKTAKAQTAAAQTAAAQTVAAQTAAANTAATTATTAADQAGIDSAEDGEAADAKASTKGDRGKANDKTQTDAASSSLLAGPQPAATPAIPLQTSAVNLSGSQAPHFGDGVSGDGVSGDVGSGDVGSGVGGGAAANLTSLFDMKTGAETAAQLLKAASQDKTADAASSSSAAAATDGPSPTDKTLQANAPGSLAALMAEGDDDAPTSASALQSAPTDAAATAVAAGAAGGAADASAVARFVGAKSTAATSFKAASPNGRTGAASASATASTAGAGSAPTSATATPHGSASSDKGDDPLNANTGDQTTVPTDDGVSVSADGAAQAFTAMGAQAGGPTATASTPGAAQTPSAGADTAANLSAQIVQKLSGQSTRFDLQLNPDGLGRVDVAVQIDAKGVLSASLSFEKPEAANLLRDHAGALQQSLAQAGFDLSNGSLSFSTANQDGRAGAQSFFTGDFSGQTAGQNSSGNMGGNMGGNTGQGGGQGQSAFSAASLAAAQTDQIAIQSQGLSARGVDIRI